MPTEQRHGTNVTINVNGLSLVHQASDGVSTATLPNPCLTPPTGALVPYPSVAFSRDLARGTRSVRVDGGHSAATAQAVFATSTGDEPGTLGGVVSGTHGAEASFLTFSPNVCLEGVSATRLTDKMLHNRGNTIDATGETQPTVKRARGDAGARNKDEVKKLFVKVVNEAGKPVHKPVKVVLKGKGKRYTSTHLDDKERVVFRNVKKGKYRVIAIHGCYPEGFRDDYKVSQNKQEVEIRLLRGKLRDVANIPVGVSIPGNPGNAADTRGPQRWDAAKEEFDDVVIRAFWASNHGEKFLDSPRPEMAKHVSEMLDVNVRPAIAWATARGLNMELTPLFWPLATPKPDWQPNPRWEDRLKTRDEALTAVKDYIASVALKVSELKAMDQVKGDKKPKGGKAKKQHFYAFEPGAIQTMLEILRYAGKAFPNALLIVNDYGVEGYDGKRSALGARGYRFLELMRTLRRRLLKKETPDDAKILPRLRAGFQAHLRSGGELGSTRAKSDRLDFRPRSIRRQVAALKKLKLHVCVTECDLELPAYSVCKNGKKQTVDLPAMPFEAATETVEVQDASGNKQQVRRLRSTDIERQYFQKERAKYLKVFAIQRDLSRDILAAILWHGTVDSFIWWDFEDCLPDGKCGSTFRYHGYLFHRHLVCTKCKDDPAMKVPYGAKPEEVFYKKPKYWGAVAAFKSPRRAGLS
ncbi:PAAR-like domain-containing protein [Chondromyces apiculatus]|uniref:GH10 domain-containing protein n=1 Tax=Chondromyces apiculatus DSM 436 TaxID=1192034 RepID=A0A017T9U3_9BACT|nr:PAAR-like domain-containing protein [Chondromyces apiculatus]EYF05396.1 Hypothetical protein CAP_3313 [Chondromyces apiculatus DSM 436]